MSPNFETPFCARNRYHSHVPGEDKKSSQHLHSVMSRIFLPMRRPSPRLFQSQGRHGTTRHSDGETVNHSSLSQRNRCSTAETPCTLPGEVLAAAAHRRVVFRLVAYTVQRLVASWLWTAVVNGQEEPNAESSRSLFSGWLEHRLGNSPTAMPGLVIV